MTKAIRFDWRENLDWLSASSCVPNLTDLVNSRLAPKRYGDLVKWMEHFENLPVAVPSKSEFLDKLQIGLEEDLDVDQRLALRSALQGLIPWRKGPIQLFDQIIDTEWRSDWKWDRVQNHLDLKDKTILDVGCGNGYHLWRMLGHDPARVIGVDPSPRFVLQFYMLKKYYSGRTPIDVLPLGIEELPALSLFDTVFSMGVLYHRRSPMEHLGELFNQLRPGGQLILETLVIAGDETNVLLPENRYAMMPNVWFIPSAAALKLWIRRAGFEQVSCIDESVTTVEEQRSTDWMRFHSLSDFLDQDNAELTCEGYPRPRRAVVLAKRPE